MKVTIVWPTPNGDRILDRLSKMLSDCTGWPVIENPDPQADLNYFMVYIDLAQRHPDWNFTPLAAYFSHQEPESQIKALWWDTASEITYAQTATAERYAAILPNPIPVVPPVDPMFEIRDRHPGRLPLLGFSGFVDWRTPRKGADLASYLTRKIDGRAEFVASGDGWPARHVNRSFTGLVDFYNKLDAYVCTATIEGVPMPPLEALACGIPIVIPRGVGMLDDLPDASGVYRYEKGDSQSLLEATLAAIEARRRVDRQGLRALVGEYTPEAWAESHRVGFERVMKNFERVEHQKQARTKRKAKPVKPQRGVYYVAYGGPARACAESAMKSFKQHLPDIPIALASDQPIGIEDVFIDHIDEDIGGRAAKVQIYDLAPQEWTHIAYLDADTEIIAGQTLLWQIVEDGWDMAICKNPGKFHMASAMRRPDNGDECEYTYRKIGTDQVMQFNGGVFAFQRNERTKAFFDAWHSEWRRYGGRDQAALLRALWQHPLKLFVLGGEWNTIVRDGPPNYDSPGIAAWLLHYPLNARRWRGVLHHRLDDPKAWEAVKKFEAERKEK